jgi:hypothetical protein
MEKGKAFFPASAEANLDRYDVAYELFKGQQGYFICPVLCPERAKEYPFLICVI